LTDQAPDGLFAKSQEAMIERRDNEMRMLLFGYAGGPLRMTLDEDEKRVLRHLRFARGLANTVSIRELTEKTQLDARSIKQIVRTLRVNFRLPIGSSKRANGGGYYLMVTDADRAAWRKDVTDQIRAEVEVLRAADGRSAALEVLGQLSLEVQK